MICDLEQRYASGGDCTEKVKALSLRVKIQGLALIVPGNGLVEGIVLRGRSFFRVKT
jgi:hypothetical protein